MLVDILARVSSWAKNIYSSNRYTINNLSDKDLNDIGFTDREIGRYIRREVDRYL
jgi:uncharacterized protein YjiS (DUF1127 family)